jgi:hypothetical protein
MNKNTVINQLAVSAIADKTAFTDLYQAVEPQFKGMFNSYLIKNNLTGFNFDSADYISAIGQSLWESIVGYDSTKGDLMPRLVLYARRRMKDITDFNLAGKRFDKSKQVVSYELLFESEEFDLEDKEAGFGDTASLVSNFIKADKDGNIISVLTSTGDNKLRNEAFTNLFGKYEATERKRVQRVKQRLQAHLTSNGVCI